MTATQNLKRTAEGETGVWTTLNKAAAALGETRQTVLVRIVAGELTGKHEAGRTLVTRESLDRAIADKAAKKPKASK